MNDEQRPPQGDGNIEDQLGIGPGAPGEMEVEAPRREASLTLATDDAREARAASMEAAHRSLYEALGITYRLLQLLIVALVLLFLLSGFRSVGESELAVKTRFGEVVESDIPPGFTFSLPYPVGDVRMVGAGQRTLEIDTHFFPRLSRADRNRDINEHTSRPNSLNPVNDGSLITADGNQAIARLQVSYRLSDATNYLQNAAYDDAAAERLVRLAVQSAMVHVAAETPIDELVGRAVAGLETGEQAGDDADADEDAAAEEPTEPAGDDAADGEAPDAARAEAANNDEAATDAPARNEGTGIGATGDQAIEFAVRQRAQDRLDELNAGITVTSVVLRDAYPPRRVLEQFSRAARAIAEARTAVDQARNEASSALTSAAGSDYEAFLALLDEYEVLVDSGREDEAEQMLTTLSAVLDGEFEDQQLVVGDRTFASVRPRGEIVTELTQARSFADQIAGIARSQAQIFEAAYGPFTANPESFVARTWSDAFADMFEIENLSVEVFTIPDGARAFDLLINSDPEIIRREQRERNRRLREEAIQRREQELGL